MKMTLSDHLHEGAKDVWEGFLQQDFVRELGEGTLSVDRFRFYMIQDYRYLLEYVKVFACGIMKAKDEEMMHDFTLMLYNTLHDEMKVHKAYMKRLGISEDEVANAKTALANASYTSYMLDVAQRGDVLDVLVAVLSCAWSYEMIGQHHKDIPGALEHPFFGDWVTGYCSDEYRGEVTRILENVNRLGEGISETRKEELCDVFRKCCLYERGFWELSYDMEMGNV